MQPNLSELLPAYEVKPLDGFVKRNVRKYVVDPELSTPEKKRYLMVDGEIKEPAGYLVFFPKGHSIRVSEKELVRLGFTRPAPLVDMKTGESVEAPTLRLQQLAQHRSGPVEVETVPEDEEDED